MQNPMVDPVTGLVVVGNIGSKKRSKYAVVGRHVNIASRIESYTRGGQILVSECTKNECEDLLKVDGEMKVTPKGIKQEITIYDVSGVMGETPVLLPEKELS